MKVTIFPDKKKIYVKGDLKGQPVEDVLDEIINEAVHFQIEVEHVKYTIPISEFNNNTTTITGQAGD